MSNTSSPPAPAFIETKEYRRFAEFCDASQRYRYIGLCYGPPGVGKTLSARHYARWDLLAPILRSQRTAMVALTAPAVAGCRSLVYTPTPTVTPKQLTADLQGLRWDLKLAIERTAHPDDDDRDFSVYTAPDQVELLLID